MIIKLITGAKFKFNKTTFAELNINDVFGLNNNNNIDLNQNIEDIVDTLFIMIKPITTYNEDNTEIKYKCMSLKDGKLFDFQEDRIVYHNFKVKNDLW